MDVSQALKDTENSLRDFIADMLSKKFGDDWIEKCGVSPQRISGWKEKQVTEQKRQESGTAEERLLYFADFYDLPVILKKHWDVFSPVFGEWKKMEVFLDQLQKFRDPTAHGRELLPDQKHLILGICGEIRNLLTRYRSKQETGEDYYPRIESVRDNYGNIWVIGQRRSLQTKTILRPGDKIDFVITANDPLGEKLMYCETHDTDFKWTEDNNISITLSTQDVRNNFQVCLWIKSLRDYHAKRFADDSTNFRYCVLPPKS